MRPRGPIYPHWARDRATGWVAYRDEFKKSPRNPHLFSFVESIACGIISAFIIDVFFEDSRPRNARLHCGANRDYDADASLVHSPGGLLLHPLKCPAGG